MRSAQPRTAKKPSRQSKAPQVGVSGSTAIRTPDQDKSRVVNRKPLPLDPPRLRKHCPVCGEVSYSAAGIHPQCAMQEADAKRTKRIKRVKSVQKARMTGSDTGDLKPWHRVCPRCKAVVHIRRRACSCGNRFSTAKIHNGK
jgi:hypothetical protein